jgi:hypothetical protein
MCVQKNIHTHRILQQSREFGEKTFSSTSYSNECVYAQWTASEKLNLIVEIGRKILLSLENV